MSTVEQQTLTAEDYHGSPGLSQSMSKDFRKSRRLFEGMHVTGTIPRREPTRRMEIGTVGHAAILEPHVIDDLIVEIPPEVLTSNGQRRGKAWDQFVAENPDKVLFSVGDIRCVRGMQEAAWRHPVAGRLLRTKGATEHSLFWNCTRSGLDRKARIDKLAGRFIVDIKTTECIFPADFARVAANLDYDFQAAYYTDGIEQVTGDRLHFVFITVSPVAPYPVRVYKLNADSELAAWQDMDRTLTEIAACYDSGDWSEPGENDIVELGMPRWKFSNQWELSQ